MTALRCTQNLLTAMKVKPAASRTGCNVLGDWSLNLLHVHPEKLVLAMSEHDRFAFVLKAAPYATLAQRFVEALFVQLQTIGVNVEAARQECEAMQPLVITATTPYPNRLSLQANLKDYAWLVEDMLYEGPFTIAQINARLADFLIGFDGKYDYPYQRVLVALSRPGDNRTSQEHHHDIQTTAATRPAPESMAGKPRGSGTGAGGVSPAGVALHAELDGAGERAGQSAAAGAIAESTRPLEATRELATAAGALTYTEVSERIAVNLAHCLGEVLDQAPDQLHITPEWICSTHYSIAGTLFPDWAGRFRKTDVQVGTHFPPTAYDVPVQIRNFCLDLEERLRHVQGAASIAELLAWVDWRFQWIHPFKDFNGRTGRVLLVALTYKLGLPPMDPAASESDKAAYFAALRAADAGDMVPLTELWLERLGNID